MKVRAIVRLFLLAVLVTAGNAFARIRRARSSAPHAHARDIYHRLSGTLVRLLGVHVERSGRLPHGLCVVVANHRSYVDIPLMMSEAPSAFLAKSEIGRWPLFGTAARLCGTVFVERDDRDSRKRALERLGALLDRGERITVFPEGTTSTGPGCLPFRTGVFRLAVPRNIAVVPVAIAYRDARDAWIDDASFVGHFLERFDRPRMRVVVAIGPPLFADDVDALKQAAERWIAERLAVHDEAMEVAAEIEGSPCPTLSASTSWLAGQSEPTA
jgi:1-acyl-sn-glycerol-3-phosphate acyltransferase